MALNDKVLHFLVSFAITIVLFVISGCIFASWSPRKRLLFAGICTFLLGLVKEIGDGWLWEWPWCPCSPEGKDLLANLLGILLALVGMVHLGFISQAIMAKRRTEEDGSVSINVLSGASP